MSSLNFNKVVLAGHLTETPKLSVTPSGVSVCRFTVAYNPPKKGADPEFYDVEAWRRQAELVSRWFRRGSGILVEGRMKQESWDDKRTGFRRTKTVIEATDIQFVDGRGEGPEEDAPEPDEDDLRNAAKPKPELWSTPGARAGIAEAMKEDDENMPF